MIDSKKMDKNKKALVIKFLKGPYGAKRIAYAAVNPLKKNPTKLFRDLRRLVPKKNLPAVAQEVVVCLLSEIFNSDRNYKLFMKAFKKEIIIERKRLTREMHNFVKLGKKDVG